MNCLHLSFTGRGHLAASAEETIANLFLTVLLLAVSARSTGALALARKGLSAANT
jgi:hypothetical protein